MIPVKRAIFRRQRRFGRRTVALWGSGGRKRRTRSYSRSKKSSTTYVFAPTFSASSRTVEACLNDGISNVKADSTAESVPSSEKLPWKERYAKIRESRANARCQEKAIFFGVCSGLVAQAIHNKLTLTVEVRTNPAKYLALVRAKFVAASLLFGLGVAAYAILVAAEKTFAAWEDFDDAKILTSEEKDEARANGWDIH